MVGLRLPRLLILCSFFPVTASALEVAQLSVSANDLALRRQDGYLYASVAGSDANYGNRIVRIDPQSGQVVASVGIGSEPGKLAISDDGTTLYVALGGAAAVRMVDLVTFTAGTQFALGSDPFFGPFYAEDIAVQPGHPDVALISLMNPGISPRHAGVAVFQNGVARALRTPRHTGSNRIEFSADPSRAYGYNNETTEFGFRRLAVGPDGVQEVDVKRGVADGFGTEILFDQGRIYSSFGPVLDPEPGTVLGTFPFPDFTYDRTMVPDGNRAYFVTGGDGSMQLHEFDSQTFTAVLRQSVSGVQGRGSAMVRWGADGLAFRAQSIFGGASKVVILRRIHEPPSADLSLSISESTDPVTVDFSFQYTITVANAGPQPAQSVVVRARRPPDLPLNYVSGSQGFSTDSSGTLVCTLGTIAAGQSATIMVSLRASSIGIHQMEATAYSQTLDPNMANNSDQEQTEVTPPPTADYFIRLARSPDPAVVDLPVVFDLTMGNRGPFAAPLAWSCNFFGVPMDVVQVDSPRGSCGGSLYCSMGSIAPGDSFLVRITAIPRSRGWIATNAYLLSSVQDLNSSDNALLDQLRVFPSVPQLLNELIQLVQSMVLKPGNAYTLVRRLRSARDATIAADTASACGDVKHVERMVNNMAGRGLTVEQAADLLRQTTDILTVLGCGQATVAVPAGDPTNGPSPGTADDVQTLSSEGEDTTPHAPAIVGDRLRFTLQEDVPVKVQLLDVQGRLLETTQDGPLATGHHAIPWSSAPHRLSSGTYFVRLMIGDNVRTLRHAVIH